MQLQKGQLVLFSRERNVLRASVYNGGFFVGRLEGVPQNLSVENGTMLSFVQAEAAKAKRTAMPIPFSRSSFEIK